MLVTDKSLALTCFQSKYGIDDIDFCKQFHSLPQPVFEINLTRF